jgi:hypothetical protein
LAELGADHHQALVGATCAAAIVPRSLRRRRLEGLERAGWEIIARQSPGTVRRPGERGSWTVAAAAKAEWGPKGIPPGKGAA